MKIVKQSAVLENPADFDNAVERLERAGRTCYKSECRIGPGTAERFIRGIIDRGHESVIEHVSVSVRFICDRGVSHEIVRHRLASYSQESTRYCNYGKADEIQVVEPPGLTDEQRSSWLLAVGQAEDAYLSMLGRGATPQIARSVLPTCLKTELVMTANLREWRHFFRLRCAPAAHPQMREVALQALELFRARVPVLFNDILNPSEVTA